MSDITGTCSLRNRQDCLQVPWQNLLEELNDATQMPNCRSCEQQYCHLCRSRHLNDNIEDSYLELHVSYTEIICIFMSRIVTVTCDIYMYSVCILIRSKFSDNRIEYL